VSSPPSRCTTLHEAIQSLLRHGMSEDAIRSALEVELRASAARSGWEFDRQQLLEDAPSAQRQRLDADEDEEL
jgi:hypothetical protein